MKIYMDDSRLTDVTKLKKFLKGSQGVNLSLKKLSIDQRYDCIESTVKRLGYKRLKRREKRAVLSYLKKITGYKKSQLTFLIARANGSSGLKRIPYKRVNPNRIYSTPDIKLLEHTDEFHLRLSEKATKEILRREYEVFDKKDFQTIAKVSHSHITNLRASVVYKNSWINHTKARQIGIGITMKPQSQGKPGSIRIDSVSQKDVYHINTVDEITQWEIVFCVPQITEEYMRKALPLIFDQFPFTIFNFHSDRGGENINHQVASYLQELLIKQTKSRSCHTNDNALVEGKNASVVRKNMGWEYIHRESVGEINKYYKNYLNIYLNYHRPSGYPTIKIDEKGKKKKIYNLYLVPYEFLKSLPNAKRFLKKDTSFKKFDKIAYEMSDNDFAQILRNEERKLFNEIRSRD